MNDNGNLLEEETDPAHDRRSTPEEGRGHQFSTGSLNYFHPSRKWIIGIEIIQYSRLLVCLNPEMSAPTVQAITPQLECLRESTPKRVAECVPLTNLLFSFHSRPLSILKKILYIKIGLHGVNILLLCYVQHPKLNKCLL